MNKSQRAALFVFLSLLAALTAGLALYFAYGSDYDTAVPLLAGCVLIAFGMLLAAARLVSGFRRSRRLTEAHQVPPSKLLHALDLRQWLTLTVGITAVAIGTGALTGVSVLAADKEPVALPAPTTVVPPPPATTEPAPVTVEETSEPEPTEFSAEPTETDTEPEPLPSNEVPLPEATKYLDSEEALEGDYDSKAVAFSGERHTRGIQFYCSRAKTSVLQWNVAGMTRFNATAGIDDAMENTFGKAVEFLFYDQDGRKLGKPVEVSVGHPKAVKLDLTNVVSLRMTCATRDAKTNEERTTYANLGDPVVASE